MFSKLMSALTGALDVMNHNVEILFRVCFDILGWDWVNPALFCCWPGNSDNWSKNFLLPAIKKLMGPYLICGRRISNRTETISSGRINWSSCRSIWWRKIFEFWSPCPWPAFQWTLLTNLWTSDSQNFPENVASVAGCGLHLHHTKRHLPPFYSRKLLKSCILANEISAHKGLGL